MKLIRERLENWGKVAWIPILLVSSLSLLVGFRNYRLQVNGLRPIVEFSNADAEPKSRFVRLYWEDVGKADAWHPRLTLYSFDDPANIQPLTTETEITGAGGKMFAGYGGHVELNLSTELPKHLLACVAYAGPDGEAYQQQFVLAVRDDNSVVEEAAPSQKICR